MTDLVHDPVLARLRAAYLDSTSDPDALGVVARAERTYGTPDRYAVGARRLVSDDDGKVVAATIVGIVRAAYGDRARYTIRTDAGTTHSIDARYFAD